MPVNIVPFPLLKFTPSPDPGHRLRELDELEALLFDQLHVVLTERRAVLRELSGGAQRRPPQLPSGPTSASPPPPCPHIKLPQP